ncbi:MAG: U32 family peptidase, partial [Erysipelothrix sp.]|nr:U32 family peptidase [Erysipelothrix sp.]
VYPEIELHASTQMTIHNKESAMWAKENGFSRVVLSRELSLLEIKEIAVAVDIELEMFVQGALCISYSGQCLMSSLIGGRSGNRGRCAQSCRLKYSMFEDSKETEQGYLISPKDLSLVDELNLIQEAGVTSLKIEGRLKQPGYVVETVGMYHKALKQKPYDKQRVARTFVRTGYTKAYFYNKPHKEMMSLERPNHSGVRIGQIKNSTIQLECDISVGDGLRINDTGFQLEQIYKNHKRVNSAFVGDVVELIPKEYHEKDIIYKSFDYEINKEAKQVINNLFHRKRIIDCQVEFRVGYPLTLTSNSLRIEGHTVSEAIKKPLEKETVVKQLQKSGDSPYELNVSFSHFEAGFLPISQINEARRKLFDLLDDNYSKTHSLEVREMMKIHDSMKEKPSKLLIIRKREHLKLTIDENTTLVVDPYYQDPGSMTKRDVSNLEVDFWVRLPSIMKTETQSEVDWVLSLKHCKGVVTSNIGVIYLLKNKKPVIGDYKLNIFNSVSLSMFDSLLGSMVSEELNKLELMNLTNKQSLYVLLYSRIESMVMEYCPNKTGEPCSHPCMIHDYNLEDRLGYKIPIEHDIFCRAHLMNSKVKNNLDIVDELNEIGYKYYVVELNDESLDEAQQIVKAFENHQGIVVKRDVTRGHYN